MCFFYLSKIVLEKELLHIVMLFLIRDNNIAFSYSSLASWAREQAKAEVEEAL